MNAHAVIGRDIGAGEALQLGHALIERLISARAPFYDSKALREIDALRLRVETIALAIEAVAKEVEDEEATRALLAAASLRQSLGAALSDL